MNFVAKINQRLQQSLTKQLQPKTTTDSDRINQGEKPEISHELGEASIVDKQIQVIPPDKGRKIVFDNLDCFIEPHEMTEAHQNRDEHWVTVMETENRVSGNHLSSVRPSQDKLLSLDCGMCIPNKMEHILQRKDYMVLVSRIITEYIPCLQFLKAVCIKHIKHQYSLESSFPTTTVSLISFHVLFFCVCRPDNLIFQDTVNSKSLPLRNI